MNRRAPTSEPDWLTLGQAAKYLGVGGARPGARGLKCLHAHAAFALARPGYVLGEQMLAEITPIWPPDKCCTPER